MAKLPALPKRVYVSWTADGSDEPWLSVSATTNALEDGEEVGIYELRETKTKRVTHTLE